MATFTYLNDLWGDQGPGGNLGNTQSTVQNNRGGYDLQGGSFPSYPMASQTQNNMPYRPQMESPLPPPLPPNAPPSAVTGVTNPSPMVRRQLEQLQQVVDHLSTQLESTQAKLQDEQVKQPKHEILLWILLFLFIIVIFVLFSISKKLSTSAPVHHAGYFTTPTNIPPVNLYR